MGLTAVILTNKDEKSIRPTLDSVSFADEVLVLYDHPQGHPLKGDFAQQRNFGLDQAKNDWVVFVDDDEIISQKLAQEIKQAITAGNYSGYYLRRLDEFFGQTLRYGETGFIKLLRLGLKNSGRWQRPVHEVWHINGPVGQLQNPLIHRRQNLVSSFLDRITLYGPLDAQILKTEGKPFTFWRLFLNPLAKFIVNYKFRLGFLDGCLGLFQAYLMSVQSLSIRVFQWQKRF